MKCNGIYKEFIKNHLRFNVLYGGSGSGKSRAIAQKFVLRMLESHNETFLILRKVKTTLKESVFAEIKGVLEEEGLLKYCNVNKTTLEIYFKPTNSRFIFFGLDKVEKLKSISTPTSAWLEEADEMSEDDLLEINRRLRGEVPSYIQIIVSFNPISHLHWLKKHFFDIDRGDTFILKTTYLDNKFLDDEYSKQLEQLKIINKQQYNIYALGEWGVVSDTLVYYNFSNKYVIESFTESFTDIHVGIDFNVGGTVIIIGVLYEQKLYVIEAKAVHDTQAAIDYIKTNYAYKGVTIYPDATGKNRSTNSSKTDISLLKKANFNVIADASNPRINDRVNTVNKAFAEGNIYIVKSCDKLIFALYTQEFGKDGKPKKYEDHTGGAIDDYNDSFGYCVYKLFSIVGKGVTAIDNRIVDKLNLSVF